ncbi:unnamed protein product, partial [Brassica oleracea var. botrytis]
SLQFSLAIDLLKQNTKLIVYCVLRECFIWRIDYTEDLVTYNAADHKVEQALITLMKSFQFLIYGRKGKAKF